MVAPYAVEGDAFRAEKPRVWSDVRHPHAAAAPDVRPASRRRADRARARRQTEEGGKQDRVVFIFNFFDELRRISPSK